MGLKIDPKFEKRILTWPPYFWLIAFFLLPMMLIFASAFGHRGDFGGIIWGFTFENFFRIFDPIYYKAIARSFEYSIIATSLTLLISYPVAYYISFSPPRLKGILMFLIILPFWTNFLIRIFSWFILLGRNGLINNALMGLGIINEPLSLLHNAFSVNIGLIYGELPYMILPIIASLDRMNVSLLEASTDLGASKFHTFWRITFPISMPGIITGIIFVFIPMLGQFVVPDILGGTDSFMIGNVITSQYLVVRDWPFGSALSMALMMIVLLIIMAYLRFAPAGFKDMKGIV
jgi:spermidine/putrescine transport system permease protein